MQFLGHPMIRRFLVHEIACRREFRVCRTADGAALAMMERARRFGSVKLAVEFGLDEQQIVAMSVGHYGASRFIAAISIWRPRQSRDITVPIGVSVICAISL